MTNHPKKLQKSWLFKSFILFIFITFLFGGFQLFFQNQGLRNQTVLRIDGEKIGAFQIQDEFYRQMSLIGEEFLLRAKTPEAQDQLNNTLYSRSISELITRHVFRDFMKKSHLDLDDELAYLSFSKNPAFVNEQGEFSTDILYDLLSRTGLDYDSMLAIEKERFSIGLFMEAMQFATLFPDEPSALLQKLADQTRDVRLLQVPLKQVVAKITVSETELKAHYNKQTPQTQEQRQLEYIELTPDQIKVSSENLKQSDLLTLYDERYSQGTPEQIELAHIFVDSAKLDEKQLQERLIEIGNQIKADVPFETLVEKYSDDLVSKRNQGSFGLLVIDSLPIAFQDASKSLEVGQAQADPFFSGNGFHFLKLIARQKWNPPLFETVEDELKTLWLAQKKTQEFNRLRNQLDNKLISVKQLKQLANDYQLTLKTTEFVKSTTVQTLVKQHPVFLNQALQQAAFTPEINTGYQGLLEITPDHWVAVRVAKLKPSEPIAFEKVKKEISQMLAEQKATRKVQDAFKKALTSDILPSNSAYLKAIADDLKLPYLKWKKHSSLVRNDSKFSPALLGSIFSMPYAPNMPIQYNYIAEPLEGAFYFFAIEGIDFVEGQFASYLAMIPDQKNRLKLEQIMDIYYSFIAQAEAELDIKFSKVK